MTNLSCPTASRGLTGLVLRPPRSKETMTTDEATKSEGEVQAAALAERGEDITPSKDRGVLKVRGICQDHFALWSPPQPSVPGLYD